MTGMGVIGGVLAEAEGTSIPKRDMINAFYCRVNGTSGMTLLWPVAMYSVPDKSIYFWGGISP